MSEIFTSAERAATDFDGWHASLPDGIKADVEFQLGLAPDREAEKRKIANSLWLASRTGLDLATVGDNYETVKEGWALNQGLPVEAYAGDEQFSSIVRARATEDAAERTMLFGSDTDDDAGQKSRAESLATNARRQALWHPTMPEDARPDSGAWQQVRRGAPGFKPERSGYYEGLFSDIQAKERARFAPVLPVMNEAWEMLTAVPKGDEVLPGDVWDVAKKIGALGEKEASLVLAGLRERGEMLPDGDRDAFFSRLGQTMTRALNDIASGSILELGNLMMAETLERAAAVTKAFGGTETGRSQEADAAELRRVVRVANRLTSLRNEKIDPVNVDSLSDKVGMGIGSSIPNLVAGIMSGGATIMTSSTTLANEELSGGFEAAGMSGPDSDRWAAELAPYAGGLMWAAEYFTFGMARGPAAILQRKLIGKMATSAPVTRLAAGLAMETGEQFAQEVLQDSTPVMVAELANAVGAPVPEQDVLKRIAEAASPETFGVSIVFALGGGGMMPRVEQARALKSIGFSDAAVEAVVTAPDESARAAAFRAGILDAKIENAVLPEREAPEIAQAEESFENADAGIQGMSRTRDGWTVTTADGNQTQVDSGAAAVVLRDSLGNARSEAEAEAMVEIADYLVGIDPTTEIQPTGKRVEFVGSDVFETIGRGTPRLKPLDDATRQSLEAEIDILRRTEGGEETMRGLIDGSNVIDWKDAVGGQVERIINRINTSGDVMTQFHEFVEGRWKAGIAKGGITPEETFAAIRAYERATGRLALSENATPDEVREAVSNLASAYVFARKKDGTHSPAGAVHKGMKAAIQSAVSKDERRALGKFRAFLRTVRAFWRHVFQTAAAIKKAMRDGKLKPGDDFTGFMDKLLGVADQRAHEAAVAKAVGTEVTQDQQQTGTGETFAVSSTSGLERLARQVESRAQTMKPVEKAKLFDDISAELAGIARSRALQDEVEGKPSARKEMLRSLVTLDAILAQLPAEVRVRIGGFVKLASLQTTPARLRFIEDRVKKIEVEAEKYFRRELTKAATTLFKQSKPRKGTIAGEKMLGKLGADAHELIKAAQNATKMDAAEVAAEIAKLESLIQGGTLTPEQVAMATMEQNLVHLAGDWKNADAAQMSAAVTALDDVYHDGLLKWAEKVKKRTERREGMRDGLQGNTGKAGDRMEIVETEAKRLGFTGQTSDWFLSLSSFEEVLRYAFGDASQTAVGLADAERKAAYQYEDENQEVADSVGDFFKTLTDGDTLAAEKLRFDLSQRTIETGAPWGKFSELEAIQGLMMWRQDDGRRHMEGNGITQAWIDKLESKLTDAGRATMAFISDQYAGEWEVLNKIYKERHGVNLPRHLNYSPLTVQPVQGATAQTLDPVTGMPSTGSILTPNSIRTRSTTAVAKPRFADALQTLIGHKKQLAWWKAYYDLAVDLNQVFGNRELMESVQAAGGEQLRSVLSKWAAVFSQGGNRDAAAGLATTTVMNRVLSRFARMALVGRMGTLLIQSTQLGAAAAEMPAGAYVQRFGKLMAGQLGWKKAIQSSFIQRRIKQAPPIVRQALEGLSNDRPNRVKHISNSLGMGISWADGIFTAGTYAIIFDYQLQLAKDAGLTGAAAEATAHKQAERITERVAQPTRMGTRSLFENLATRPLERLSFAFASEARQKMTIAVWAAKHAKNDPARAARAAFVVWGVGGLMAAVIRNAWRDVRDDDDDEVFDEKIWGAKRLMMNTLAGPLQGVPLFGEAMESLLGKAFGVWTPSGDAMDSVSRSVPAAKRLATLDFMEDDEQLETAIKDAEAIMGAMGLFNETMASAKSIGNALADAAKIADNLTTTDKEAADLKAKADAKAVEEDRKAKREAAEAKLTPEQKAAIKARKDAEKIRERARNAARAAAIKAAKENAN